jgi:hypothetical protein
MEKPSWTTIAAGAFAAVAVGVAVYYLAQEDEDVKLDL